MGWIQIRKRILDKEQLLKYSTQWQSLMNPEQGVHRQKRYSFPGLCKNPLAQGPQAKGNHSPLDQGKRQRLTYRSMFTGLKCMEQHNTKLPLHQPTMCSLHWRKNNHTNAPFTDARRHTYFNALTEWDNSRPCSTTMLSVFTTLTKKKFIQVCY